MTISRKQYNLDLCPSPGKQKGMEYRTPVGMSQEYDAETNRITVTIYMLPEGMNPPDKIIDLSLCPEGQQCGCRYPTEIGWQINDDCSAKLYWTWPEAAKCLLKSGYLIGGKSGAIYLEELYQDPGNEIYPVGDIRNPDCPGCGMAGVDREATEDYPVPGELFSLSACIDEETCLSLWGAGGCHPIGSELFQTVGFMGGLIYDIFDEDARVYEVLVDGVLTGAQGTDLTKYTIGQWVALAKIGTEFPLDEWDERVPVTNQNVPTVGMEEYLIIPYQFAGAA
jgi:hypothetical protein